MVAHVGADASTHPWCQLPSQASASGVTVFTMSSGPTLIVDQDSRTGSQLAGTLGQGLQSVMSPKAYFATDCLLVVVPLFLFKPVK